MPLRNDPKFRALAYQLILLALVLWFGYQFALNAKANLQAQQITGGYLNIDAVLRKLERASLAKHLIEQQDCSLLGRWFVLVLHFGLTLI